MSSKPVVPRSLFLLREEEHGKLYFSTEPELVMGIVEVVDGRRVVSGQLRVPCTVLAEWQLDSSVAGDLAGLVRLFGGVFEPKAKALNCGKGEGL